MRIISTVLLVVVGLFVYSLAWSLVFSFFNTPDTLAVFFGVGLAGFLIGLTAWVIQKEGKQLFKFFNQE